MMVKKTNYVELVNKYIDKGYRFVNSSGDWNDEQDAHYNRVTLSNGEDTVIVSEVYDFYGGYNDEEAEAVLTSVIRDGIVKESYIYYIVYFKRGYKAIYTTDKEEFEAIKAKRKKRKYYRILNNNIYFKKLDCNSKWFKAANFKNTVTPDDYILLRKRKGRGRVAVLYRIDIINGEEEFYEEFPDEIVECKFKEFYMKNGKLIAGRWY